MDDAIAATIYKLQRRNQNPFFIQPRGEFTPTEITAEIKTYSEFTITYDQTSARKLRIWPASIDDHQAREDWG
jgi:hypothetical protein